MSHPSEMASGARAILEAATEAFSRAGFDSVSLTDVANQAKVCKANIFHHFKSKDALYVEVLREACKGHAEFTEALLARSDLSSVDKLRQLIHFDFIDGFSNEQRFQLVIREILNTGCNTGRNLIEPVFLRNFAAVIGLVYPDRRGAGFALNRYRDNPRLDFTRVASHPAIRFAHARGFVAKTSLTAPADLKALLTLAGGISGP